MPKMMAEMHPDKIDMSSTHLRPYLSAKTPHPKEVRNCARQKMDACDRHPPSQIDSKIMKKCILTSHLRQHLPEFL